MQKRKLSKNLKVKASQKSPGGVVGKLKRKDHISYSQIMNARCLYRYKVINLLNQIKIGSVAMVEGSIVHNIIYEYTRQCFDKHLDSDYETMALIVDQKFEKSTLPESTYRSVREKMLEFAEVPVSWEIILAYEKRFSVNIGAGVVFEGVIDRVNSYKNLEGAGSVIEIIDYKNFMNVMTQQEVEDDLQLQLYKYIACNFLFTGFDMVRVGIYHTRYNFVRWSEMKNVIDCGKEFENNEQFLYRQWQRIIKSPDADFVPKKCEACWEYGGCEVMIQEKCPLYTKSEIARMKKNTTADRVRALRHLDIQSSALKQELKAHFSKHEPEEVDGSQVGIFPSFSHKYDMLLFYKWAIKNDIPMSDITLTKTDVEKSLKKVKAKEILSESDMQKLEDMKITSVSNRFKY